MNDQMNSWERIVELLRIVPRAPEEVVEGASAEALQRLQVSLGCSIPGDLKDWLSLCNGTTAGPGGIFGTGTGRKFLNIEYIISLYPEWRDRHWIPVASDGTGGYYVLDLAKNWWPGNAVLYLDTIDDPNSPAWVAATSLPKFLTFLLEKELDRNSGWPFRRQFFEERDPDLISISDTSVLPWS